MLGGSLLAACSTQKNTPATRWWHAFNANYNTYYNGSLAFIDGALEKENGNKDNYTELIPLYTVANKNSRDLGKGNFDRAIEKSQKAIRRHSIKKRPIWDKSRKKTEKDIEWLNRKEYNPFLWKAWLMMGKSQFMKGDFEDAASTFAYMSRLYAKQPAIYGKSRAWLAKCYVEQDWLYDAEDVIKKMERDSLDWRAVKEWNYTYADYYIHCNRYEEAIPYLKKVIKRESRRKQKAREYFLLGQLYAAIGNSEDAYRAYRSCLRCHPPYELQFNARIASTCVAAEKDAQGMIGKLKRMARNENNKEYLDQVYFALGNIYLAQKDTVNAISSYEKGNEKATRSGIEKGVLLLSLGNLYWQKEKFSDAKRCYGEAIGLLDKDHKDYNTLSKRSVILDELVPHTEAIHLNDSLLALSTMDEKARNEAIDRVIAALKKREKEEADRLAEQNSAQNAAGNNSFGNNNIPNRNQQQNQGFNQNQSLFYFYNPTAVSQGKQQFEKLWGKRQNVDDWQRNNKTVVAFEQDTDDEGNYTEAQLDSINKATAKADSINELMEKPENDPHKREYYMKDIPFTDEQKAGCHKLIADGLYNSGVIFKDKLDNLPLSEKQFMRLQNDYPEYENNADLYYHLFLLYNRKLQPVKGDEYLDLLKAQFPDNQWTKMLSDPYFAENARFGKQMEDSIYGATYTAFKESRFHDVYANYNLSSQRFTTGDNRDRFIFIYGLSKLNDGATQECLTSMETVVKDHPQSPVQAMAGMIINGVKEGRRLYGGTFDLENVWSRRTSVMADSDSITQKKFNANLDVPYTFMFVYNPDSVENENKLLFELARFNFTTFMVRNFEIKIENVDGMHWMQVSGFRSYHEARQYARQLYEYSTVAVDLAKKARPIIINDDNMLLLGNIYSYDDYAKYYEQHYVPLKLSTIHLLTEPIYDDDKKEEPEPDTNQTDEPDTQQTDDSENQDSTTITDNDDTITVSEDTPNNNTNNTIVTDVTTTVIEDTPNNNTNNATITDGTITVTEDTPNNNTNNAAITDGTITVTEDNTNNNSATVTNDDNTIEVQFDDDKKDDEIIVDFGDDDIPNTEDNKQQNNDIDDEYLEIEDF